MKLARNSMKVDDANRSPWTNPDQGEKLRASGIVLASGGVGAPRRERNWERAHSFWLAG